jgi:hypothetical protein
VFNSIPITFYIELDENKLEQSIVHSLQPFISYYNLLQDNVTLAEQVYQDVSLIPGLLNKASPHKSPISKMKKIAYDKKNVQFLRYTMPLCHFNGGNLWLLKPTFLNRGRGIHVFKTIEELKGLLMEYCQGKLEIIPAELQE